MDHRGSKRLLHIDDATDPRVKETFHQREGGLGNNSPEQVDIHDLVPVVETVPGCAPETNPSVVHEDGNLEHTDV